MADIPHHLSWLQDRYGPLLSQAMADRGEAEMASGDAIVLLARADPTPGQRLTDWLVRTYVEQGTFKLEDVRAGRQSTVGTTLALFAARRGTLPPDKRNINLYESPGALWNAVGGNVPSDTSTSSKRRNRDRARSESVILVEDTRGIVAVPLTQFAACWWGRGTRWCTAAREDNAFHSYARKGPLFVLIPPGGAKAQFHACEAWTDLRDAADNNVSASHLACLHELLDPAIGWMVGVNGRALRFGSPLLRRDKEVVLRAVRSNFQALEHADPMFLDDEDVMTCVVKRKGGLLRKTSEGLRHNRNLILESVRQDGTSLSSASVRLQGDRDVVLAAVRQHGSAFFHASPAMKSDRQVALEAFRTFPMALNFMGKIKNDPVFVRDALALNGLGLNQFSKKHRHDREMVLVAVRNSGNALMLASDELRDDKEVVLAAVTQCGQAIEMASERLQMDHDVIRTALTNDGGAVRFLEPRLQSDRDTVLLAVSMSGNALQYVSSDLRCDREVVLSAVRQCGLALHHACTSLRASRSIVLEAVMQDGMALRCADPGMLDETEIVMAAVRQNGLSLRYASRRLQDDKDIVLAALGKPTPRFIDNGRMWTAFDWASSRLQDDEEVRVLAGRTQPERYDYDIEGLMWSPVAEASPCLEDIRDGSPSLENTGP